MNVIAFLAGMMGMVTLYDFLGFAPRDRLRGWLSMVCTLALLLFLWVLP